MAGGPLYPVSVDYPAADVGPGRHVGATNSRGYQGIKVVASLGTDRIVRMLYQMPPSIPSGTLKQVLHAMSVATSGAAKFNPAWFSNTPAVDTPDDSTLSAEGTSTLTWAAGDDDELLELKITLDASTAPVAGDVLEVAMTFESTGWTLASPVVILVPPLIWE